MYNYKGTIINVVDGDTFDVEIDLGFQMKTVQRVRLYGINTPELNSPIPEEREKALEAKQFIENIMFSNPDVKLTTIKPKDKYGRYLARVIYTDKLQSEWSLADDMIEYKLGKPYFGEKK